MNKAAIIYWGSLFVWCILISLFWIKVAKDSYNTTSSPVEEMYHRQLVNTIDSILDSRYPCGITEDDSAYPSINSLSSIAVPNNR